MQLGEGAGSNKASAIRPNNRRITRGSIGDKSGGVIGLDYV